jgi:hypothetical protein
MILARYPLDPYLGTVTRSRSDYRRLAVGSADQSNPAQRSLRDGQRSGGAQREIRPCHLASQLQGSWRRSVFVVREGGGRQENYTAVPRSAGHAVF